jgi:carboxy-cis,cis-muconate cyclase
MKKWSSFTVQSPSKVVHHSSHGMTHHPKASSKDTKTRAIFLLAAKTPPFNVYCNPFYDYAGHGSVFSINPAGNLDQNVQNYDYAPESAIHGMVFDPEEQYLYSADMWGNSIWTHRKTEDGKLKTIGRLSAPAAGDHPRWVEMHPSGRYLYALMEAGNRLCEYVIDEQTHLPVYTHRHFPLIPPGKLRRPCTPLWLMGNQAFETPSCIGATSFSAPTRRATSSPPRDPTLSRSRVISRPSNCRHRAA